MIYIWIQTGQSFLTLWNRRKLFLQTRSKPASHLQALDRDLKAWQTSHTLGREKHMRRQGPRVHSHPQSLACGWDRELWPDPILIMHRLFVSHCQPIRFARFDGKSVNRGLPVLDQTRALDPNHRPEGS